MHLKALLHVLSNVHDAQHSRPFSTQFWSRDNIDINIEKDETAILFND